MGRRLSVLSLLLLLAAVVMPVTPRAAARQGEGRGLDPDARRGVRYEKMRRSAGGLCKDKHELDRPGRRVRCVHGPDPAPDPTRDVRVRSELPPPGDARPAGEGEVAARAPTSAACIDNGTSGFRVQVIYARASGVTDRYASALPAIRQWVAEIDTVINASAAETGGSRRVRFVTDSSCAPVVQNVVLPAIGDDTFSDTVTALEDLGLVASDRKYLVFMDANVYCGIAEVYPDDRPTADNYNNGNPLIPGMIARIDNGCWNTPGQSVAAHELMHSLGGVQDTAPNGTVFNHCVDESDRMCYADDAGVTMRQVCASAHENVFDCNHDDYFSTNPPAGSYLATHWNTANNAFLDSSAVPAPLRPPDYNGDGRADLAVGVPLEDVGGVVDAGAVNVLYGTSGGLSTSGSQVLTQDTPGAPDAADTKDVFGFALASGDFNGDRFSDLAVGVPLENLGAATYGGAVSVFYGSSSGLTGSGAQFLSQDTAGVPDVTEIDDFFGFTLEAADFTGDGRDDLAVGTPFEDVGGAIDAGAVTLFPGSAGGLTGTGAQIFIAGAGGVPDVAETADRFGQSLAAGDYDGNGRQDLAVGMPFEDLPGKINVGAVNVLSGSSSGLTPTSLMLSQDTPGVPDVAEEADVFAWALGSGDFNGDGRSDLAVGVILEDEGTTAHSGALNVVYGSATGLSGTGAQYFSSGLAGMPDVAEANDFLGMALEVGDFNGDGRGDIAVAAPPEDIGTVSDAGAVTVLYGSASGITTAASQFLAQSGRGFPGTALQAERTGTALRAADFTGDGRQDLAIGVPVEDSSAVDTGALNVVLGAASGLFGGTAAFSQGSAGMPDPPEAGDLFAFVL